LGNLTIVAVDATIVAVMVLAIALTNEAVEVETTDNSFAIDLIKDAVLVEVTDKILPIDLIKDAVLVLTTLLIKLTFLTNDAVVVLLADLVSEIARLKVATDASVTDNKTK